MTNSETQEPAAPEPQPVPAPRSRTADSSSRTILVALIAALAAVVGALAGGFATYLGNKSLQESQSHSTAVGIGRVIEARLVLAESRFQAMVNNGLLLPPNPGIEQVVPSAQDEETLASNLSAADWTKVSIALADYELFTERGTLGDLAAQQADRGQCVPLGQDRSVVAIDLANVRLAAHALIDLTGSP
jgi:hypothetical protein